MIVVRLSRFTGQIKCAISPSAVNAMIYLFSGFVRYVIKPLKDLDTAIRHTLLHHVAVHHAKLPPDSHLDIGPQPNCRTGIHIQQVPHGILPTIGSPDRFKSFLPP